MTNIFKWDDTPLTLRYYEKIREQTTLQDLQNQREDHIRAHTIETEQGETITAPLVELLKREIIDHEAPVNSDSPAETDQAAELKASELADIQVYQRSGNVVTISLGVQKLDIADLD